MSTWPVLPPGLAEAATRGRGPPAGPDDGWRKARWTISSRHALRQVPCCNGVGPLGVRGGVWVVPTYGYECPPCGGFQVMRPMAEATAMAACPQGGREGRRTFGSPA